MSDGEKNSVSGGCDQRTVGDRKNRRCVENDVVELRRQLREDLTEATGTEQLRRVRGRRSGCNHAQPFCRRRLDDIVDDRGARQCRGQPDSRLQVPTDIGRHARGTQVGVHEDDAFTVIGQSQCEVDSESGFAFAGHSGGDGQDGRGIVNVEEAQVRPHSPELFSGGRRCSSKVQGVTVRERSGGADGSDKGGVDNLADCRSVGDPAISQTLDHSGDGPEDQTENRSKDDIHHGVR